MSAITPYEPAPLAPYQTTEWYRDVPRSVRRHSLFGILLLVAALGGFGAWAFQAPLKAAVISQGTFVATGNNKVIQHLEGGIIAEILVAEGDRVAAGDTLLRLDTTASQAVEQELFLRRARLEGMNARLTAQAEGHERMLVPAFLEEHAHLPTVAEMITDQQYAFDVTWRKLHQDLAILQGNLTALELRVRGYTAQHDGLAETLAIIEEELDGKTTLLEKGLMRADPIHALRRARADGEGQRGRLEAQIAETEALIARHREEVEQVRTAYLHNAVADLDTIRAELDSVREHYRNARQVHRRAAIDAPVSGTVVQLNYNTPGGVIEGGKVIAEILPADVPLIIEVSVPRTEIDVVTLGQPATVRLVALNQRTTPVLYGEVFYISADALRETGGDAAREVYLARIELPAEEFARVPGGFVPLPGMPAEVMIQTAERTFAQYIAKPITDSMARAFREQ